MLTKFRKALLMSSATRNLAIDLVKENGAGALDIIDQALSIADQEHKSGGTRSDNEQILTALRVHIVELLTLL